MFKNLFIAFFLLFSSQIVFANKVDDLKTDEDVQKFFVSIDTNLISPKYARDVKVFSTARILNDENCYPSAKNWGVKNWVKADFNNDGRTDLLVTIYWESYTNYIAIDKGDNTFQLINISYSPSPQCELINTIKKDNMQLVLFHRINFYFQKHRQNAIIHSETDTLIYKFGGFVELNRKPVHYKIDSITFNTGACYGTCPTFEISIDKFGNAGYIAGQWSKKPGTYKAIISKDDLNKLDSIINYIAIKKLKNSYAVNWTDSPTCSIKVNFADGSVKYISDYGELGTFGLQEIYNRFFNFTANQNWVASK